MLFEIATIGPGFAIDEDPDHLGERLSLPAPFEPMREQLERTLKPLPYPPAWRVAAPAGYAPQPSPRACPAAVLAGRSIPRATA